MDSSLVNTNDSASNVSTDLGSSLNNGSNQSSNNLQDSPFAPLGEVVGEDNLQQFSGK